MDVSIYTEQPVVDVANIINHFFGQATDSAVYDMAILFSFMIFFIFLFCILGVLFRSSSKK